MVTKSRIRAFLFLKRQDPFWPVWRWRHTKLAESKQPCHSAGPQKPTTARLPDNLLLASPFPHLSHLFVCVSPSEATPTACSQHHPLHNFVWREANTALAYSPESKCWPGQNWEMPHLLRTNRAQNAVWGLSTNCLQLRVIRNSADSQQHIVNESEHWLQISSEKSVKG